LNGLVMSDTRSTQSPSRPVLLLQNAQPTGPSHDCVVALKALGEDTRVRIVGLLVDNPLDVGEIADRLAVSQYNVSKHLRILREAGLVEVEKMGRQHRYALPHAARRAAGKGNVLDLGCCSFQFEDESTHNGRTKAVTPRRRRMGGGSTGLKPRGHK
jgi:DNA-binding transcriptional ArsR family regulator